MVLPRIFKVCSRSLEISYRKLYEKKNNGSPLIKKAVRRSNSLKVNFRRNYSTTTPKNKSDERLTQVDP